MCSRRFNFICASIYSNPPKSEGLFGSNEMTDTSNYTESEQSNPPVLLEHTTTSDAESTASRHSDGSPPLLAVVPQPKIHHGHTKISVSVLQGFAPLEIPAPVARNHTAIKAGAIDQPIPPFC